MKLYLLKKEWTERGMYSWTDGRTEKQIEMQAGIYDEKLRKEKNALRIEMKLRRKKN